MREDWIAESKVAELLMVGETMRDTIRDLRRDNLFEGEDFIVDRNKIIYSPAGIEKLAELLKVRTMPESLAEDSERETTPEQGDAEKKTPALNGTGQPVVKRVWPKNSHYLLATMDGADITICVRDATNFTVGLVLNRSFLKRRGQFSQIYDFCGRCPRSRGRW